MSDLQTTGGTGLQAFSASDMADLLGIDESLATQEVQLAAEFAAANFGGRSFKVDYDGKTVMKYSNLGQFSPIKPGEEKPSGVYNTIVAIPLSAKFWVRKTIEETVNKDGNDVVNMKTECESVKRIIARGEDGKPTAYLKDKNGKDVDTILIPQFGAKKTAASAAFEGSKYGDCSVCPFLDDKTCKGTGSITLLVLQHNNEDVEPYVAEMPMNYTSTINVRKMLDLAKKQNIAEDPREIVMRIGLDKNTRAVKPFWEFTFDILTPKSKLKPEMFAGWVNTALRKMAVDKEAAKQARQQKQLASGGGQHAQIAAPAQPAAPTGGLGGAMAGADIPPF